MRNRPEDTSPKTKKTDGVEFPSYRLFMNRFYCFFRRNLLTSLFLCSTYLGRTQIVTWNTTEVLGYFENPTARAPATVESIQPFIAISGPAGPPLWNSDFSFGDGDQWSISYWEPNQMRSFEENEIFRLGRIQFHNGTTTEGTTVGSVELRVELELVIDQGVFGTMNTHRTLLGNISILHTPNQHLDAWEDADDATMTFNEGFGDFGFPDSPSVSRTLRIMEGGSGSAALMFRLQQVPVDEFTTITSFVFDGFGELNGDVVAPVPEPTAYAACSVIALLAFAAWRRARGSMRTPTFLNFSRHP
ncbi:MAG: hypothetical protein L0Z50_09960 [Verrucomicrobiales bacterium]|nr:hypothetical protein [Verrucomicrobiales bacterium]